MSYGYFILFYFLCGRNGLPYKDKKENHKKKQKNKPEPITISNRQDNNNLQGKKLVVVFFTLTLLNSVTYSLTNRLYLNFWPMQATFFKAIYKCFFSLQCVQETINIWTVTFSLAHYLWVYLWVLCAYPLYCFKKEGEITKYLDFSTCHWFILFFFVLFLCKCRINSLFSLYLNNTVIYGCSYWLKYFVKMCDKQGSRKEADPQRLLMYGAQKSVLQAWRQRSSTLK